MVFPSSKHTSTSINIILSKTTIFSSRKVLSHTWEMHPATHEMDHSHHLPTKSLNTHILSPLQKCQEQFNSNRHMGLVRVINLSKSLGNHISLIPNPHSRIPNCNLSPHHHRGRYKEFSSRGRSILGLLSRASMTLGILRWASTGWLKGPLPDISNNNYTCNMIE